MKTVIESKCDLIWLHEVHVKDESLMAKADQAVMYGNEDSPYQIDLYQNDFRFACLTLNDAGAYDVVKFYK